MENNVVIEANNLSKVYRLYDKSMDRLKESLSLTKKIYHKNYYALNKINLEVKKGEVVGIIGTNGSGKSTLLKIITGVLNHTEGEIQVNGKVSALLELGTGFNPEYTGIENIYLNGTMMNKSKEEIEDQIEEIIKFADIGDFIYQPVKTYSSGMFVRLAFAVATNIQPDILIVDEALSVGDINFQMKSINKIKQLIGQGTTVLFVSHDIITIKTLCNKALYLNKGEVVAYGDSGEICELYLSHQNKKDKLTDYSKGEHISNEEVRICKENKDFEREAEKIREGTRKVLVKNIMIYNDMDDEKYDFSYGDKITVEIDYEIQENIESLVVACYVRNRNQLELIGTNSKYEKIKLNTLEQGGRNGIAFTFNNYLQEGEYSISVILANDVPTDEFYDKVSNIVFFKSYDKKDQKRWALVGIPMEVNTLD